MFCATVAFQVDKLVETVLPTPEAPTVAAAVQAAPESYVTPPSAKRPREEAAKDTLSDIPKETPVKPKAQIKQKYAELLTAEQQAELLVSK